MLIQGAWLGLGLDTLAVEGLDQSSIGNFIILVSHLDEIWNRQRKGLMQPPQTIFAFKLLEICTVIPAILGFILKLLLKCFHSRPKVAFGTFESRNTLNPHHRQAWSFDHLLLRGPNESSSEMSYQLEAVG